MSTCVDKPDHRREGTSELGLRWAYSHARKLKQDSRAWGMGCGYSGD